MIFERQDVISVYVARELHVPDEGFGYREVKWLLLSGQSVAGAELILYCCFSTTCSHLT